MLQKIYRYTKASSDLLQTLGREPNVEEIAEEMGVTVEKVYEIQRISVDTVSIDKQVGDEDDKTLDVFISDTKGLSPQDATNASTLGTQLMSAISTLKPREEMIIRMRYGLDDGEEIEKFFPMKNIYRLLFGAGEDFEVYDGEQIWYFIPSERRSCVDWYTVSGLLRDRYEREEKNGKN
jgi:hypothetical protein